MVGDLVSLAEHRARAIKRHNLRYERMALEMMVQSFLLGKLPATMVEGQRNLVLALANEVEKRSA